MRDHSEFFRNKSYGQENRKNNCGYYITVHFEIFDVLSDKKVV
ncbi:hypothetical protein K9V48_15955 [Metabacillus sp. DBTR6]|uniref:Uncharacterized protein n=1 Tax=Metabacillus rhizolycopersici TaxID=2875709 RepID=A0ABS7UTZ9_9BACI|nr:hypothetical protein [Metabacillus rhizolycopersici]